jgi:hypothetical protein
MCLSDSWITSPLYESSIEAPCPTPWNSDYPGLTRTSIETIHLSTFAEMCKIRHIQSKIMQTSVQLSERDIPAFITTMRSEIDEWVENTERSSYE